MNEDIQLAYDKEWLAEFERVLASQTIPCVEFEAQPNFLQSLPTITQNILTEGGDMYYTLEDDYQFAVTRDHPQAKGWKNG